MTDLETRLVEALREGAEGAPDASGLASGARTRARLRRRTRVATGAALVALLVGVPTAVVSGGDAPDDRGAASDPSQTGLPDGLRVESWHGVTVEVPHSWAYGGIDQWCAGGDLDTPVVDRPGVRTAVGCSPTFGYGLSFQEIDNTDTFDWPVVEQTGDDWPPGTWVGAHGVGGVLVEVAMPTQAEALDVLATVRPIGPEGDPNGCTSSRGEAREDVPDGVMALCRYDDQGLLEQSELLRGDDVSAAVAALEAAPSVPASRSCSADPTLVVPLVRMRAAGLHANVDLGGPCPSVHGMGEDRLVTPEVLYWALSPGWSGALDEGIPLPPERRR